jgi:hypothetical protein
MLAMGILAKLALLFGGGFVISKVASSSSSAPPIKQGVFGTYTPVDVEPGATVTELGGTDDVGKSGGSSSETSDWPLYSLKPGESVELVADFSLSTYVNGTNHFYPNAAAHQFCKGLRIAATATRSATGVALTNVTQSANPEACAKVIGPDVDPALQIPWPSGSVPSAELRTTATGVQLRITAPALKFSTETAEPGKGYGPDFWSKVGPYRYTLRITGTLQSKTAA